MPGTFPPYLQVVTHVVVYSVDTGGGDAVPVYVVVVVVARGVTVHLKTVAVLPSLFGNWVVVLTVRPEHAVVRAVYTSVRGAVGKLLDEVVDEVIRADELEEVVREKELDEDAVEA